jgi:hypothetical protein
VIIVIKESIRKKLFLSIFAITFLSFTAGFAEKAGKPIQYNIAKGVYIYKELITIATIKQLPIPSTNDDYAVYQSIGKVANIIIGKFKSGDRSITLITDKNADGKVEFACIWHIDQDRLSVIPDPASTYTAAKFAQFKEDIINGKNDIISPNPEALELLRALMKKPSNIIKVKNGYKVSSSDPDIANQERISFYYSDNTVNGVDLVFEVKYRNLGVLRVSPIINMCVYCKDSFDPFAIETVKKLIKESKEYSFND